MRDTYDPHNRFWLVLSLCALLVLGALQAVRAQPPRAAPAAPALQRDALPADPVRAPSTAVSRLPAPSPARAAPAARG